LASVVIFGVGEGARQAGSLLEQEGRHEVVGYTVDREFLDGDRFLERELCDFEEVVSRFPPDQVSFFIPLGFQKMNSLRADKFTKVKNLGYACVTYVDPSNRVAPETEIGENCLILGNQSIDRDVTISDDVVIWAGCQLGDRCRIESHAWLSAHCCLNGDVTIGTRAFLASNCTIANHVTVAERSLIGANALITADTEPGSVHAVQGTPALGIDSERFMAAWPIA
jgi:sugar O-acyltransferase (sialic acid O-acetyltransferase NeuD family)